MRTLAQDLRYGVRLLTLSPAFAAVAILTLAVGIGSNTTIFSVMNAVMLRPLPFRESDRTVVLSEASAKNGRWPRNPRVATVLDWKKQLRSFDRIELAVPYGGTVNVTFADHAEAVQVEFVSPDLIPRILGVKPVLGRNFEPEDYPDDASQGMLLSYGIWKRRFGGDPHVIGKSLNCGGGVKTIIGVLPPDTWVFPWAKNVDIWVAINLTHNKIGPDSRWFCTLAHLKPGVSLEQARTEMRVVGTQAAQDRPELNRDWTVTAQPLHEWCFQGWKEEFSLLFGAVSFILLIGCANVANLLLSRSIVRQREMAVRASLGASSLRVVRQLLTESVLLGGLGGLLGLGFALVGIRLFVAFAPEWFPRADEISIDGTVLLFTFAVSMATGILFGLAPALQTRKVNLVDALKDAGARSGGGRRQLGRSALVVAETALALVLMVGAGLLVNSFLRLEAVDPGFNTRNLLTGYLEVDDAKYLKLLPNAGKQVLPTTDTLYEQLTDRVEKGAGVQAFAMEGGETGCTFRIVGQADPASGEMRQALFTEISANYVDVVEGRLVRGRKLRVSDNEHAPWVALVNEAMVRRYFAGKDPVGSVISATFSGGGSGAAPVAEERPREIVGVIGDIRHQGLRYDAMPAVYVHWRQHNQTYPAGYQLSHTSKTLLIRTYSDPRNFAESLRKIVSSLDRDETLTDVMTMEESLAGGLAPWRFAMRLFGIFSILAVSLAVVGIYGVMSYSVTRRAHEIAVRLALGAGRAQVLMLIVRQGLMLTLIGIAIGLAGSLGLTRFLQNLLYGVEARDPASFALTALLLAAVSLAACLIPALRAARTDPMVTLRAE